MRSSWRPVLALLFAWGGVVGLIRLAAVFLSDINAAWTARPVLLAALAFLPALGWWWLSRLHDAAERRRESAPRTIPASKRDSLGVALVGVEPQELLLAHQSADAEAAYFATDLLIALHNSARWTVHQGIQQEDHGVTGLRVTVSDQATNEQKVSAKALRRALSKLGFKVDKLCTMPEHVQAPLLNRRKHPVAIVLTIGTR